MKTSELSFISKIQYLTLTSYETSKEYSTILSGIIGRLAATLLSPAAAADIVFHSVCTLPACLYAIGKSIYLRRADFTLPWQHIQRVRNSIAPLFLGTLGGLIHPSTGIFVSEPTDKHAVLCTLYSDLSNKEFDAVCSPIDALSLMEEMAGNIQRKEKKNAIFSSEHIQAIQDVNEFEKNLQILQNQEFVNNLSNTTLKTMEAVQQSIYQSKLPTIVQGLLTRVTGGCLIPVLTTIDITIALFVQTTFFCTGIVRSIMGKGPAFSEIHNSLDTHITLLAQCILKAVGTLFGSLLWIVSPAASMKVCLLPRDLFFKSQINAIMNEIKQRMQSTKNNSRFVLPISIGYGNAQDPSESSYSTTQHHTYLIVEKQNDHFNLYWVDRPDIISKKGLQLQAGLDQIYSMIEGRFTSVNKNKRIELLNAQSYALIEEQGNTQNSLIANLFGTFDALDQLHGVDSSITKLRYTKTREYLITHYKFYKDDFLHFDRSSNGIWTTIRSYQKETYI